MRKLSFFVLISFIFIGFVSAQTITVTSPHAGDTWYKGHPYTIIWTKTGNTGINVKINIFKDIITPANCIGQLPVSNSGSQSWTIPSTYANGTYYIRIKGADSSWNDVGVYGDSEAFTIKAAASPSPACGALNLVSPMDGAKWVLGHEYKIKWTSTNRAGKVRLELVRYQGPMVGIIAKNLPASGSYQWVKAGEYIGHTAPNGKYRIRVRSMDKFKCFDEGDPFNLIILIKPIKLVPPPVIESVVPFPVTALTPGTHLFLKGKNFDYQPVEILMYGNFPNSYKSNSTDPIQLTKVYLESSTQINGFIPQFSDKGQLDQTVKIRVKNGKGTLSNPWKMKFEGRKEQKVVLRNDVVVLHCGDDGNCNSCNNVVHKDPSWTWTLYPNTISISGFHANTYGAIGYDKGYDKYKINLKNGWKLKSLQKVKWVKSSGDEKLSGPNPPLPVGESNWTPKINWEVSPADHVKYLFKIIVEGPLGTHYK